MFADEREQLAFVVGIRLYAGEVYGIEIALEIEVAGIVEDVCYAAGHARAEVHAGRPKDNDLAPGHVFAAVVSDALCDERGAGVADAEAFPRLAVDEDRARRSAIGDDIAGDDVIFGRAGESVSRPDGDDAAGERLAYIVVRLAPEVEGDAAREERTERLSCDAVEVDFDISFPISRSYPC